MSTRANVLREHYDRLRRSKSCLVIGGGAVGVELAAEIAETMPHIGKKKQIHQYHQFITNPSPNNRMYSRT